MADFATEAMLELRRPKRREQVTIPEPYEDVESLYRSVIAMKELVEELAGQRGPESDTAVTFGALEQRMGQLSGGAEPWRPIPYVNGWVDYPAPYSPCGYCKLSSGLVLLRGITASGTATAICVLPAGFRPSIQLLLVAETSPNVACRLDITTGGIVSHTGGSNGWISLNNICFLAEG